ncbi:MAG: squalene/phytoene synthase family protein [Solirubrobacteraceae bacterium]|nr:squalene/phytoene synthase family protein [Solirubrobacteraceae bacterium]
MTAVTEEQVDRAYHACARMQRRRDPTYYWAVRCLPAERRPPIHALYGFVRGADDIADDPRLNGARRAALDAWQVELETGLARGRSDHRVIAALVDAGPRHGMPLHLLGDYMDSMRADCEEPVRMRSQDQLDRYMAGTATVGPLVAPLLDAPEGADSLLARLGVAFQLTNLIRDVPEDWRLGRVYLPGLHEEDLVRRAATHRLRDHVAGQVERARGLFRDADALAQMLPGPMRPGVRVAVAVYGRVLDRVERHGYDVVTRPAGLRPWETARAVAGALAP